MVVTIISLCQSIDKQARSCAGKGVGALEYCRRTVTLKLFVLHFFFYSIVNGAGWRLVSFYKVLRDPRIKGALGIQTSIVIVTALLITLAGIVLSVRF